MPRILQALVGSGLFIGLGFVTRHYFPQWLEGKLKESQEATAKDMANWKPVQTNFSNIKFDQPIITTPLYNPSRQPPVPGKR